MGVRTRDAVCMGVGTLGTLVCEHPHCQRSRVTAPRSRALVAAVKWLHGHGTNAIGGHTPREGGWPGVHSPRWVCWLWPWRRTHGAVAHASSHAWPAGADQRTRTPAGGCNRSAGGQRRAEGHAVQTRDALPPLKRATQRCNRTPAHLPSDAIAMCGLAGRHLAREGCWHGEAHKVHLPPLVPQRSWATRLGASRTVAASKASAISAGACRWLERWAGGRSRCNVFREKALLCGLR